MFELLRIVERFAIGFDDLPELIRGRPDYRELIAAGTVVSRLSVVGQLMPDSSIEILQLDIDVGWWRCEQSARTRIGAIAALSAAIAPNGDDKRHGPVGVRAPIAWR